MWNTLLTQPPMFRAAAIDQREGRTVHPPRRQAVGIWLGRAGPELLFSGKCRCREERNPEDRPTQRDTLRLRHASQVTARPGGAMLPGLPHRDGSSFSNCLVADVVAHFPLRCPLRPDQKRIHPRQLVRQPGRLPQAHSQGSRSFVRLWQDFGSWYERPKVPWKGQAMVPGWSDALDRLSRPQGFR